MTTTTAPDPFVTEAARVLRAAPGATWPATAATATTPTVRLTVGARLIVPADAPPALMRALRDKFTLRNPAYEEAERYDRSTADLDEWLIYYETLRDGSLALPRGATQLVYGMCEAHGVRVVWDDRTRLAPVATPFSERVTLSAAQTRAVDTALGRRYGVIEAPPGAGKTITGLTVVARRGQRTLWLTHTKELAYQLIDRAGMVLGLTSDEVGLVGDGACRIGDQLTVALVQSLARGIPSALLDVGHVVVDRRWGRAIGWSWYVRHRRNRYVRCRRGVAHGGYTRRAVSAARRRCPGRVTPTSVCRHDQEHEQDTHDAREPPCPTGPAPFCCTACRRCKGIQWRGQEGGVRRVARHGRC